MDELITEDGTSLDLEEKVPIPLNLSIADFRNPEKRQRNFSKEISLPGTAKNQEYFSSAFQLTKIQGVYDFNSSAKVKCKYHKNGNIIFPNAVIKLNKVIILDGKPSFKVNLFSDFVDVFLALSNTDVRELDWSAYDHVLNNTNIMNSWVAAAGSGYYYPLIERNQRPSLSQWRNTDMVPYVYLVDVFAKCMALVGQEYTSAFVATTRAKNILFGYGGGNYIDQAISPTEVNNRKVLLTTGNITRPEAKNMNAATGTVQFQLIPLCDYVYTTAGLIIPLSFVETQDIMNQFVDSTFTAGRTGNYKMTLNGSIRFQYTGAFTYAQGGARQLFYYKNGVFQQTIAIFQQTNTDSTFAISSIINMNLNQGDVIKFMITGASIAFTAGTVNTAITQTITTPADWTLNFECTDVTLVEGSTVEVGRFLPSMKCSDFLLGFIRQFKLIIGDPDIYGVVKIEPEINFYQSTSVYTDISDEVDNLKEIEVRPSANEFAKTLSYKFKPGTETDAKFYAGKWLENYGDLSFDQPSFFAKGEQKIELPWATIIPYELYPNVIAPRFIDIDSNTSTKKTTAGVARIMFRNAMANGAFQLVGVSATNTLTQYPLVHHFDSKDNPTFDLNFKLVSEVFYPATVVTTINSYSAYYDAFVQEIISPEGKYVQLYRKMSSLMVKELDWTRLLMLNGALFRLNKIIDFDSEITEVTKIELIRVIEARNPNRRRIKVPKKPRVTIGVVVSNRGVVGTGIETSVVTSSKNQVMETANIIMG